MRFVSRITFAIAALFMAIAANLPAPASAGASDPLFVNMTTDDTHRAKMAIGFARKQQERKHPVTIFLNDKGVLVGAKSKSAVFKEHQELLAAIIKDGGTVVVCPMCMQAYGVGKDDVMAGAKLSDPDVMGELLFKDNTKSLTW